uniref:Ectonucleotide pyrophosphatase/phosphodiesterase 7, tandem duplicate 2 n=1 Tax=Cyprinus carpio TaxID=7962 RepID=A0A8C1G2K0_CYPCA
MYFSPGRYIENHGTSQKGKKKIGSLHFPDQDLDFVTLYFGYPDSTGHKYGPDSPKQRKAKHGLSDHLNIFITADHGKKIILTDIPGFSLKDLKFHMVDYGPSGLLLPKEGMLDKVYQALKGGYPNLHVYKKEDMPARLHYSKHPRILPIVLYADPGYVINGFCIFQKKKGEHSYDNEDMDMKPFFRAVGPDFHRNLHPTESHVILENVFIGLAAVAGFLLLMFVVVTSYNEYQRRKITPKYCTELH